MKLVNSGIVEGENHQVSSPVENVDVHEPDWCSSVNYTPVSVVISKQFGLVSCFADICLPKFCSAKIILWIWYTQL